MDSTQEVNNGLHVPCPHQVVADFHPRVSLATLTNQAHKYDKDHS